MITTGVDRQRLLRTFLELVAVDSPTGHEGEIAQTLVAIATLPRQEEEPPS